MKLSQLRDVVAIAEHRSLRAAAQHLGLAQPALTRSLRELEHELGVSLFERKSWGMRLTAMGDVFVRRARAVQAEIHRSREEIDQLNGRISGTVSVGLSMAASVALLPTALKTFSDRFRGVRLKITEGFFADLQNQILDGELDFYVGPMSGKQYPRELGVEELIGSELVVVGRRGHPLLRARSLAELADARWIGMVISATGVAEPADAFARNGLPAPRVEIETQSAIGTILVASRSDLLAMLPKICLRYPGADTLLDRIDVAPMAAPPICLVRRASLPLTPAAEFLCDLVKRAASVERTRDADVNLAASGPAAKKCAQRVNAASV
jgi:LysR family transcriptional regulator, regulator of abg operon